MESDSRNPIRQEGFGYNGGGDEHNINTSFRTKIFNDPIHGHMEIHPPCVAIIDTPQFQRLRYIKQICGSYFVYSGCSHNRFEHSIGVCYLAGQLTTELQKRQPELEINDKDILCLEIAGLCHDLGHGPFSHLFEGKFIPDITEGNRTWSHEEASIAMFDYMYDANQKVQDAFKANKLDDNDRQFIKELINQSEPTQRPEKRFLYNIVANKTSGVDVDKWDYFARDSHMLGIKSNFDHMRLMKSARVIKKESKPHICFREKDAISVYDMFHTRYTLHIRAYQHKTARCIEAMIKDALVLANDFLKFQGKNGTMLKMSEAIDDMTAYMKMTDDNILNRILYEPREKNPNADRAREILENVLKRNVYKLVDQTQLKAEKIAKDTCSKSRDSKESILTALRHIPEVVQPPHEEDVFVDNKRGSMKSDHIAEDHIHTDRTTCNIEEPQQKYRLGTVVNLNYGKDNTNPIDCVYFYSKTRPDTPFRLKEEQVSHMLPKTFEEQCIRLYIKNGTQQQMDYLKEAFLKWCKDNNYPDPKGKHLHVPDSGSGYSYRAQPTPQQTHSFQQQA